MPLSLEHLKMLSAKPSSLERGTGGTPEISFHEVADLLARVEYPVSIYARYVYAKQRGLSKTLVNLLVDRLKPKDLDITPKYYFQIAELAIRVTQADYPLTNSQKAFAIGSTCGRAKTRTYTRMHCLYWMNGTSSCEWPLRSGMKVIQLG